MGDLINISLCLSDIPREAIKQAENGKKYLAISVSRRKEIGKYEETHTVSIAQSKEEREAKKQKTYIGSGWEVVFAPKDPTVDQLAGMPSAMDYDPIDEFSNGGEAF